MKTRDVILVSDGDYTARKALEIAAEQLHLELLTHPVRQTSKDVPSPTKLYMSSGDCPYIVMLEGQGSIRGYTSEQVVQTFLLDERIRVLGALAVASNTSWVLGVRVAFSLTRDLEIVKCGVNKDGQPIPRPYVFGDGVDALRKLKKSSVIVGIGDIGKMDGKDAPERGAPVTTAALRAILAAHAQFSSCEYTKP